MRIFEGLAGTIGTAVLALVVYGSWQDMLRDRRLARRLGSNCGACGMRLNLHAHEMTLVHEPHVNDSYYRYKCYCCGVNNEYTAEPGDIATLRDHGVREVTVTVPDEMYDIARAAGALTELDVSNLLADLEAL